MIPLRDMAVAMLGNLINGTYQSTFESGNTPQFEPAPQVPLINVQSIYDHCRDRLATPLEFEASCLRLPWEAAVFTWGWSEHPDPSSLLTIANSREHDGSRAWEDKPDEGDIDWSAVAQILTLSTYAGKHLPALAVSGSVHGIATTGPMVRWELALDKSGTEIGLRFTDYVNEIVEDPLRAYRNVLTVMMASLEFLNFTNIDIEDEPTDRATRRRDRRALGEHAPVFKTLYVYPPGPKRKAGRGEVFNPGLRHHGVRGHEALYGPDYNRGLLFGRYAGRFWIRPHSRGNPDLGEVTKVYDLRPRDQAREQENP